MAFLLSQSLRVFPLLGEAGAIFLKAGGTSLAQLCRVNAFAEELN
jgi:hypothetical protein